MATIASAKPTWASWGVSMQSPTAQTPFSPVRHSSSTTTKPRSSTWTPVPSRPRSAVAGLRPTDIDDHVGLDRIAALDVHDRAAVRPARGR